MKDIEVLRKEIEETDKKIAELFKKRMETAKSVALYKKEHSMPVFIKSREEELIHKNLSSLSSPELEKYYLPFIKNTIELSKAYQEDILGDLSTDNTEKTVHLNEHSYKITIKKGSLQKCGEIFDLNRKILIVTDENVPEIYSETVKKQCKEGYIFKIRGGEKSKNLNSLKEICRFLVNNGFTRNDAIVAVGGGVVGDIAGFAASIYMRGIDFYNIPTTVLSQVDSAVGGKTAVNFSGVKNILGSFHQPKAVIIDTDTLKTLNRRQIANGLSESVKMGITLDSALFDLLTDKDYMKNLDEIIKKSIEAKIHIVELDEKESGLRKVLNFGHTLGHGFEITSKGRLLHGEAVALGMIYMTEGDVKEELLSALNNIGLPTKPNFKKEDVLNAVIHDKKAKNGGIDCIVCKSKGSYEVRNMSIKELESIL